MRGKGVGTAMGTVIIIAIFTVFFATYLYMANNNIQIRSQLNLESLEFHKLKSTFDLFNSSLGMTWFISTVQSIFMTADDSIGCGIDTPLGDRLPEGYWYKTNSSQGRDGLIENGKPIERIPTGKYNAFGRNPQICYPRDNHVVEYMKKKLEEGGFLNLRELRPEDAGGVSILIDRKQQQVDAEIHIRPNADSIESKFFQTVHAQLGNGRIDRRTENVNVVQTSLIQMVAAGRRVVEEILNIGDDIYANRLSHPLVYRDAQNKDAYQTNFKTALGNIIIRCAQIDIPIDVLPSVDIVTDLKAATDESGVLRVEGSGLVLHYKARVRYIEGSQLVASQLLFPWPTESRLATSCYGWRRHQIFDVGKFHYGIDIAPHEERDPQNLIKAVAAGVVVGMNGICPRTNCEKKGNTGYGNYVIVKHDEFYSFYGHLASVSVSLGQNVAAGEPIGVMGDTGSSRGLHLHFEIRKDGTVGTMVDPCNYIDCTLSELERCTSYQVSPTARSGIYYYHDEDANTFVKRPVTLEYNIEEYLPVIDCLEYQQPPFFAVFNWERQRDMICCGGFLFSCNTNILGLAQGQQIGLGDGIKNIAEGGNEKQQACKSSVSGATFECTLNGFDLR